MKVQVINDAMKYWVVRPGEGAQYFKHFHDHSIIALGHVDNVLGANEGTLDNVESSDVKSALLDLYKKQNEQGQEWDEAEGHAAASSAAGQVSTFVNEMNLGDVIITLDSKSILIGRIVSQAYVENTELKIIKSNSSGYSQHTLSYKLRRKIKWESIRQRVHLPTPIKPCFSPSQTVFSISESKIGLFKNWLFSIYFQNDKLFFSTKINEPDDISQFNLTEFQRAIQKIELIADRVINNDVEITPNLIKDIDRQYLLSGINDEFTLSAKNSFLSEGNIWSTVTGNKKRSLAYAIMLGGLFNVEVVSADDVFFSSEQIAFMEYNVKSIKDDGDFDLFRQKIQASLDSPNLTIKEYEEVSPVVKDKIEFPKTSSKGEIGI